MAPVITVKDVCAVEDALDALEDVFERLITLDDVNKENQNYAMARVYTVKFLVEDLFEFMQAEQDVS